MNGDLARECPGLPAEWINGWLAAVGTTVLDPEMRLSWTSGPSPIAVLHHPDKEPEAALSEAWPGKRRLEEMPLARDFQGSIPLERQVPIETFVKRVESSRGHPDAWTLTSSLTDLAIDSGKAAHAPFDPAGPGTIKWLHHRLLKIYDHIAQDDVDELATAIKNAIDGISVPVIDNGLGFDISRLPDRAREGVRIMVEPVVEVLAFFGLALLPVRGDGLRQRKVRVRQRGHGIGGRRENTFVWPAWSQPLDRWGIDALLDAWHRTWKPHNTDEGLEWRMRRLDWDRLGVNAGWTTKPYRPTASADSTRGFSSERIQPGRSPRQFKRSPS